MITPAQSVIDESPEQAPVFPTCPALNELSRRALELYLHDHPGVFSPNMMNCIDGVMRVVGNNQDLSNLAASAHTTNPEVAYNMISPLIILSMNIKRLNDLCVMDRADEQVQAISLGILQKVWNIIQLWLPKRDDQMTETACQNICMVCDTLWKLLNQNS